MIKEERIKIGKKIRSVSQILHTTFKESYFLFCFLSRTWFTLQLPAITRRPACTCVKTCGYMTPLKCQKRNIWKTKISAQVAFTYNSVPYIMLDSFFSIFFLYFITVISTYDICPINLDHNIAKSLVSLCLHFLFNHNWFPYILFTHKHLSEQNNFAKILTSEEKLYNRKSTSNILK